MFRGQSDKCEELDGFYLVIADPNRQRPLNRFYGDYQRAVTIAGDQVSFNAIEDSSPNPHVLTNFEKWAERLLSINPQKGADALYLLFRYRHTLAPNSDEAKNAANAQDFGPKFGNKGHVQEGVTGKQRQLHQLSPVAPAMYFCHKRQKSGNTLVLKLSANRLLVLGTSVDRIPLRLNSKSFSPLPGG
jgi:hypothetical protein